MERLALEEIVAWNKGEQRKPLVLLGARQVGKTWLMDEFAKRYYPRRCVKVDLQRDERLRDRIEEGNVDPKTLIDLIQASTGKARRIKAGHNAKAKSLGEFLRRYDSRRAIRTTLNDYHDGGRIVDIPLYAFASYLKMIPKGEPAVI